MKYLHLTQQEVKILNHLIATGQITEYDLPKVGALQNLNAGPIIGMDSMGPMRDTKTDRLFDGIQEALFAFSETLAKYELTFAVATNGPDVEGIDILQALNWGIPIKAFAVTEGGGKYISRSAEGELVPIILAKEDGLCQLRRLEEKVATDPVMKALLENTSPDSRDAPIKTPYDTNIVLTFPNSHETFIERLKAQGLEFPDITKNSYLDAVLSYAASRFAQAIREMQVEDKIALPLVKKQNRRVYLMPKLGETGKAVAEISKAAGVWLAYHQQDGDFVFANSLYVADKAADVTGEGQEVVGASEKNMITDTICLPSPIPPKVKFIRAKHIPENKFTPAGLYVAEIANRLTINITMGEAPPRVHLVEGVKMLDVGSGLKSLETITHLYERLHR
ncbi:hypothetical protein HYX07_02670 [Candidatus Woesearchaeota archaeon]|nr:hypothetical protein [Candidatus Woesearchaeota archaeon]